MSITEALVLQPAEAIAVAKPTTERAIIMAQSLKEDTEQRALVKAYVKKHMVAGIDYGTIPGTQKDTLLKPGAEKLVDLFRCTAAFEITERIEDWDKGMFHYEFRTRIASRDTSTILAEGFGSANSKEGIYRWRNAARKCPHCGKETIITGKEEYGGGYICFAKKGGCGAKWDKGAPEIEKQGQGKVENDDIYTLVNTILKMAKKRALVDGAIALARCSDIFTQDVEDMVDQHAIDESPAPQQDTKKPRDERKATIRENLTGDTKLPDGDLLAVLAGIENASTLEELVTVQPLAGALKNGSKDKARKAYAAKREELTAKGTQRQPGQEG
jgi:hypothetical protein